MEGAWRVRGVRGATTVHENSRAAVREAVVELVRALMAHNQLVPEDMVMVMFTCTPDLDSCFPSQMVREELSWEHVPFLDLAHLGVQGSLKRCIRVIIQVNTPKLQAQMQPVYLRGARGLRPDLLGTTGGTLC
ncbi:chorismate mutase [Anthocerotibacter panamensis]|uniref:chorismate mutase n=1 Tax=Anthocerotibacter panamensis TaxID=2857077 RepID=UPI001C402072|nr:chorismate mutase [Anthocerotibacter panamensis]